MRHRPPVVPTVRSRPRTRTRTAQARRMPGSLTRRPRGSTRSQQLGRPEQRSSARAGSSAALPASPWTSQMYVVYAVIAVISAVLFFVGMGLVGNKTTYDDQVPGINLAIVGVVLGNAAGV